MTESSCLDEDQLFGLIDEPDPDSLAAKHVLSCPACASARLELASLYREVKDYGLVRSSSGVVVLLTTVLSAAALWAVLPNRHARDAGEFVSRGERGSDSSETSSRATIRRFVDLSFDVVESGPGGEVSLEPLSEELPIPRSAHLLLSVGTLGMRATTHLLCFALDEHGEAHWLYPAFDSPGSDPASVRLVGERPRTAMPTEALLDEIPPGRVHVFAVVSEEEMHVDDVESLVTKERTAIEARFPNADVRSWTFSVDPIDAGETR